MTDILVVNQSTLVTDTEVRAMARAWDYQIRHHASQFYGSASVHYATKDEVTKATAGDWVMSILDDSDQQGVLGWHTQEGEVIYGRVFARPSLDAGSTALTGPYAVSATGSHEVLETLADPHINAWIEGPNGLLVSKEVGDPVESFGYTYHDRYAGDVELSDFVLPEFWDPNGSAGEVYDFLGKASAPLKLTHGGYWVQAGITNETQKFAEHYSDGAVAVPVEDRGVTYVFGKDFPEWKRAIKMDATGGRNSRRTQPGVTK